MDDADTADPRPLLSEQEREQFLAGLDDSLTVGAIELMVERPVSPQEVATAMERPLDEVRRHLDRLRSTGLIVVVDTVAVDGTSEPLYRGPFIPFHDSEEWG